MADVLTPEQRRLNMSRIRGRDTKPEMLLRRGLHRRGLRFRLHRKDLPGCPDLVFPRFHAVLFVHGCFWHGHSCPMFKVPATRTDFWLGKISGNVDRDRKAVVALVKDGWRVLTIWECALRGRQQLDRTGVLEKAEAFLMGKRNTAYITGRQAGSASAWSAQR